MTSADETPPLMVALRTDEANANDLAIGTGTAVVFKDPDASNAPD